VLPVRNCEAFTAVLLLVASACAAAAALSGGHRRRRPGGPPRSAGRGLRARRDRQQCQQPAVRSRWPGARGQWRQRRPAVVSRRGRRACRHSRGEGRRAGQGLARIGGREHATHEPLISSLIVAEVPLAGLSIGQTGPALGSRPGRCKTALPCGIKGSCGGGPLPRRPSTRRRAARNSPRVPERPETAVYFRSDR
jgi:hypothetical protein